ncbi:MAG TPA: hypothetical protein ENL17_02920, partial [Candidatus Methanoperedenaceae archaeon]|nr:hypothetical protein [Candidatus Methanoperedenaceae archaeon]
MKRRIVGVVISSIVLVVISIAALSGSAAAQPQEWFVSMNATTSTEGSNLNLGFGTNESATDDFDSGMDIPHA